MGHGGLWGNRGWRKLRGKGAEQGATGSRGHRGAEGSRWGSLERWGEPGGDHRGTEGNRGVITEALRGTGGDHRDAEGNKAGGGTGALRRRQEARRAEGRRGGSGCRGRAAPRGRAGPRPLTPSGPGTRRAPRPALSHWPSRAQLPPLIGRARPPSLFPNMEEMIGAYQVRRRAGGFRAGSLHCRGVPPLRPLPSAARSPLYAVARLLRRRLGPGRGAGASRRPPSAAVGGSAHPGRGDRPLPPAGTGPQPPPW